jgi:hypothetical protein
MIETAETRQTLQRPDRLTIFPTAEAEAPYRALTPNRTGAARRDEPDPCLGRIPLPKRQQRGLH